MSTAPKSDGVSETSLSIADPKMGNDAVQYHHASLTPLSPWRSRYLILTFLLSILMILNSSNLVHFSGPLRSTTGEKSLEKPSCLAHSASRWSWSTIKPDRELVWTPCFNDFQCARLDVPLDWLNPSEEKRVVIAMIKLPATDLADYRGAVIFNPGGPGGSGVAAMRDRGKAIQKIVGLNHESSLYRYSGTSELTNPQDLISFDPRGVGATIPPVDCWPSKQLSKIWNIKDVGEIDSHPGVLYDVYARSFAQSQSCIANSPDIIQYVSTTSVARDMLEIVNRGGYQKLKYWGFSYGTMLGGMFAALYPDKVERLVSDGNVDYEEWTTCSHLNALHDTDKVMDAFYDFCHKAGPSGCEFYSPSPAEIEKRLERLQEDIKMHPVIVSEISNRTGIPEIITYSKLRRMMSTSLYQPVYLFPSFATVLAALEKRKGSPFLDFLDSLGMYEPFSCDCDGPGRPPEEPPLKEDSLSDDAFRAIMCTDGGGLNETVEEFREYADHIMKESKAAGAVNVLFRIACVGWTTKAKWAFTGPFVGNTSHPILYIANKADNVTPLRSARQNSRGFKDSVILIQNSYGHTTLSAPSMCTAKYIRAYFQDGKLPPPETHCEADLQPFEAFHPPAFVEGADLEIWSGLVDLARSLGMRQKQIYIFDA